MLAAVFNPSGAATEFQDSLTSPSSGRRVKSSAKDCPNCSRPSVRLPSLSTFNASFSPPSVHDMQTGEHNPWSDVLTVRQIPGKARPAMWYRLGLDTVDLTSPTASQHGPGLDFDWRARWHRDAVRKLFKILDTQGATVHIFLIADVNLRCQRLL